MRGLRQVVAVLLALGATAVGIGWFVSSLLGGIFMGCGGDLSSRAKPEPIPASKLAAHPGPLWTGYLEINRVGFVETMLSLRKQGDYRTVYVERPLRGAVPRKVSSLREPTSCFGPETGSVVMVGNEIIHWGTVRFDISPAQLAGDDPPRLLPAEPGPSIAQRVRPRVAPLTLALLVGWVVVGTLRDPLPERDPEEYAYLAR